jgi:hypothetical protein
MNLDKRLEELIADEFQDSRDTTLLVKFIKTAFKEEGYVSPENVKKVQEMVNQMANLANDAFHVPTIKYIKPNKATTKAQNLMTGQEFYNRYLHELTIYLNSVYGEEQNPLDFATEQKSIPIIRAHEAARRASGISEAEA